MIPLLSEDSDAADWLRVQLTEWLCTQVREGCTRIVLRIGEKISGEGRQRRGSTIFGLFSFRAAAAMHVDRMLLLSRSLVR
jgi:hypothetical protein